MKRLLLYIILFIIFFTSGFGLVMLYKNRQTSASILTEREIPSVVPTFALDTPRDAYVGTIASLKGYVKHQIPDTEEWKVLQKDDKVFLGETLVSSAAASLVLNFPDSSVSISENTTISLPTTLKQYFVVQLNHGKTTLISKSYDVSVRVTSAVFTLSKGEAVVNIDDETGDSTILLTSGTGKVGIIDSDNTTQVKSVKSGETITINPETQAIKIK